MKNINPINAKMLEKANEAAVYNLYLYLAHKTTPIDHESLHSIVMGLEAALKKQMPSDWSDRDRLRMNILKNSIKHNPILSDSGIGNLTRSKSGLTACTFTNQNGEIFVVFRGTGSGEWIDNGEGLSGIPEENTYIIYDNNGIEISSQTVENDYAADQQVEALNWFNGIAAKNGWNSENSIIVSGHSKGGNKAQFITIHSDIVDECFSFDGQGFSPEALSAFKKQYGSDYERRIQKISSLSTDNDYVNVLGNRLMPESNIYYFESSGGLHYLEAMLDDYGYFHPQCEPGVLSRYIETVSNKLMSIEPIFRQYATLGIMNIFQQFLGEGLPVNADTVSVEETIAGLAVAIGPLLQPFLE